MALKCLFSDKASKRQNTPKINQNLGHPPQNLYFSVHCQKIPKVDRFCFKSYTKFKNQCNAMSLMMNNLLVKTGLLLYIRRTEILKYQISIFNSALSVSAQSWVFSDEMRKSQSIMTLKCLQGGQTLQKTTNPNDLRRKRTYTAKCLFLTLHNCLTFKVIQCFLFKRKTL